MIAKDNNDAKNEQLNANEAEATTKQALITRSGSKSEQNADFLSKSRLDLQNNVNTLNPQPQKNWDDSDSEKSERPLNMQVLYEYGQIKDVSLNLEQYLLSMDQKFNSTKMRQQQILVWTKYYSMLQYYGRAHKNYLMHEAKLRKLEREIKDSANIDWITQQLGIYNKYSKELQLQIIEIKQKIERQEALNNELGAKLMDKKRIITAVHNENIHMASFIQLNRKMVAAKKADLQLQQELIQQKQQLIQQTEQEQEQEQESISLDQEKMFLQQLSQSQSKELGLNVDMNSREITVEQNQNQDVESIIKIFDNNEQKQNYDEQKNELNNNNSNNNNNIKNNNNLIETQMKQQLDGIQLQISQTELQNVKLKLQIESLFYGFIESEHLFDAGLAIVYSVLLKSQEVSKNNGMNGSLLFELQRLKFKKDKKPCDHLFYKKTERFSQKMDSQMKHLVIGTLQDIVKKKKGYGVYKNPFDEIWLSYENFQKFSFLQLIGLLYIKQGVTKAVRKKFRQNSHKIGECFQYYHNLTLVK